MVCDFCAKIRKKGKKQRMKGLKNEKKGWRQQIFHYSLFAFHLFIVPLQPIFISTHYYNREKWIN
jgi:hypothetical protein